MSKAKTGYMTSRNIYKTVKKYDHAQFDGFCRDIYANGFEDGRKSVPGLELDDVLSAIGTVKGIGEARMQNIKDVLNEKFGGAGDED